MIMDGLRYARILIIIYNAQKPQYHTIYVL